MLRDALVTTCLKLLAALVALAFTLHASATVSGTVSSVSGAFGG